MKTRQELIETLDFVAEYATYLLGSGVHTSRVIRNSQRIGTSQGVDIQLSSFQRSTILTVRDEASGEAVTRVVRIPALPVSFERNSDLSALSWDALDEELPLDEVRRRFRELIDKPRMDPVFVLLTVGLANASFCRLFGGDWTAVGIVFTATLVGFAARQRMQAHGVNHYLIFIISAFMASLCASVALRFDCTAEIALATSPLFLVPGVPLINGVIDIVEGHILIGFSRLINALLLIICIAVGLAATLLMVKDSLL
ncbi:threonine/serine exporter family protein [uncultured Alistipes sp.]|uniref:threonine/serine ThrE exporter family protein n=1 Tax=uncultured Alistipes sp. TaxID=538949 RepID=UPI002624F1D0|nr:threonine/serine exporter family protein [uncultured Alistipes sp.]